MRIALRFLRGFAIAAALGVAGCHLPVSRATSPDGQWTVEVRSRPRLFGLFGSTVVTRRKGPDGKWDNGNVIDMCDWADAKKKYGTIDITNDRAVFGDRVERFDPKSTIRADRDD